MKWLFEPLPPSLVEVEVTQRDQFRNDEVGLATALVRENVQNAMDAATGPGPVVVRFGFRNRDTGLDPVFLKSLFDGHQAHQIASNCLLDIVNFNQPRALVIEDFNTTGLTGSIDTKDESNFSDFWRRHGQSHKGGSSGGRWGLGKLVYSSSSMTNSFFGLTVRAGEIDSYVMGQTVLANHTLDGVRFPAHAFYADRNNESGIAVPSSDPEVISRFTRQFRLHRNAEPGLSVIIPFPNEDISKELMVRAGIENYFYPIITRRLVLRFEDIEVNADNIRELAPAHSDDRRLTSALFEFISELNESDPSKLVRLRDSWFEDSQLDENDFETHVLERLRREFSAGKLVGVELPLQLKRQSGEIQDTQFRAFLKRPAGLSEGRDLYVRGCLTVPGEAKFGSRKAFGAMVADDEPVAAFLADAENPAHTKWTQTTEKLRRNYKNPQKHVRAIQNALRQLYDALAEVTDEEDNVSLKRFFWTDIEDAVKPAKRGQKSPTKPSITVTPAKKTLRVEHINGGFTIRPTAELKPEDLPLTFKVRLGYDVVRGCPFKAHVPWDFDLTGKKGPRPTINARDGSVEYAKDLMESNCLALTVINPDFAVKVAGFDPNRDLVVDLKTVEASE